MHIHGKTRMKRVTLGQSLLRLQSLQGPVWRGALRSYELRLSKHFLLSPISLSDSVLIFGNIVIQKRLYSALIHIQ